MNVRQGIIMLSVKAHGYKVCVCSTVFEMLLLKVLFYCYIFVEFYSFHVLQSEVFEFHASNSLT